MSKKDFLDSQRGPSKLSKEAINQMALIAQRRQLVADGVIGNKKPSVWQLDIGEQQPIVVSANTRSEARSKIKQALGLKSLPPHTPIKKVIYEFGIS
jgi:ribosomal protein L30E